MLRGKLVRPSSQLFSEYDNFNRMNYKIKYYLKGKLLPHSIFFLNMSLLTGLTILEIILMNALNSKK